MDANHARREFLAGRLTEAVVEPADQGNGWMLVLHAGDGASFRLTDAGGTEKIYHSLDTATAHAKDLGFDSVRVEEAF